MARFSPRSAAELAEIVMVAAGNGTRLAIAGGGSKAGIGRAVPEVDNVDMTGFSGVIDYDPPELVLTVGAATPLAEIEALVRSHDQMLAFEPFDHGPMFGRTAGKATIGGIIAAGVSGPRRLTAGGARDHLLGFTAVSGRGEVFKGGAKVVKNVTGYDLPKVMTGSWGRLAALTEVTVKVLPRPRESLTRVMYGLEPDRAWLAMARALGSGADVSAAAHVPPGVCGEQSVTALRLEGFGPSVAARSQLMQPLLGEFGPNGALAEDEGAAFWAGLAVAGLDPARGAFWRISLPARQGPDLIMALGDQACRWSMDWGGALLWLTYAGDPLKLREIVRQRGGHAMLVRPGAGMADVPAFHPQPDGVARLEERIRRAFDPAGVFETGRFGEPGRAD